MAKKKTESGAAKEKTPKKPARKPNSAKKQKASSAEAGPSKDRKRRSTRGTKSPQSEKATATQSRATPAAGGNGRSPAATGELATEIRGARTHNLKSVSLDIPHGRLTVITGVSGSGKSSLAFDTLFAEGQRRFVESMSTYARQFLQKMPRPDVDAIHNIQPAIALEQKNPVSTARSTVGTATELNDYLRLLFARAGELLCPNCGIPVEPHTPETAVRETIRQLPGARVYLLAPVRLDTPNLARAMREQLTAMGFYRIFWQGEIAELADLALDELAEHETWQVLVDRLRLPESPDELTTRMTQAFAQGFEAGRGQVWVREAPRDGGPPAPPRILYRGLVCDGCGKQFKPAEPALFSFYSPLGACKTCEGLGRTIGIDWAKCIPNHSLSINGGAIAPWNTPGNNGWLREFKKGARAKGIPLDVPYRRLSEDQREMVRQGGPDVVGLKDFFDDLGRQRYKVQARITLARYRAYERCPACNGSRLVSEALQFKIDGRSIYDFQKQPISHLRHYFERFEFPDASRRKATERLLQEIRTRLVYLDDVGLGYLSLDRQTRTLSGGESQRINLATALGSALTDTLYVLDEPTVGLHPRDTHRLLSVLQRLRDNGNTVVVVEHDKEVVRGADGIVDIGPRAGEHGGEIVFEGTVEDLKHRGEGLTAEFLRREASIDIRRGEQLRKPSGWVEVRAARANNLKYVDARFPLGVLACVTGVSGSGKTTLVRDTLYAAYKRLTEQATLEMGEHDELRGHEALGGMTFVDQTPIGRSSRSNPVTYTKAYDEIRRMMARTPEARRLGRTEGDFSFNVRGGRCDVCEGTGVVTVDLHFLGEITVPCDVCGGRRFKDFMLAIRHRGKNIDDILNLTISEALEFFEDEKRVARALEPLVRVGLGYLRLGQSTATLSGGELQRLKLATYITGGRPREPQLLIFDEPTTGLHPADLDLLLKSFESLVETGYSLLVVEHNLDLIARADYIIEMGPEGGERGGEVVYAGPPEGLLDVRESHTARFLRQMIRRGR